ncbi:unnamed protein product [Adineta ricciae]|uniref:Uncharacterized protein n=1 Tax=Adineta ricciae TaxID=249248 RepID=A0A815QHL9_ADIRI|nr:unnamed protein product [Adineta ricciae]CAF1606172.1 unnamed protein product [Adineta ricciae]
MQRVCTHGRLSTRLYFLLLGISMIVIIIYSSLLVETIIEQIMNPTLQKYYQLQEQYLLTLRCPCTCSQLAIPYDGFVRIEVEYHQICSNEFVQPWWYQSVSFGCHLDVVLNFIVSASSYFQTLV